MVQSDIRVKRNECPLSADNPAQEVSFLLLDPSFSLVEQLLSELDRGIVPPNFKDRPLEHAIINNHVLVNELVSLVGEIIVDLVLCTPELVADLNKFLQSDRLI